MSAFPDVYVGRRLCGCIAAAIVVAGREQKTIGKTINLWIEDGLLIDRVTREQAVIATTCPHNEPPKAESKQLAIDFDKPAAGEAGIGPAEMGEGFTCTYSGECPNERKGCPSCEYAGSIFQKLDNPPADLEEEHNLDPEADPVLTEDEAKAWGERMQAAAQQQENVSEIDGLPILQVEELASVND